VPFIARSHWRVGPNRALCDLPQIILAAYFLSKSFGDCLPEKGVPVPGECKPTANFLIEVRFNNCELTANSALMIVLSLATSAAYFGCTHATKRPLQTCIRNVPWKLPFETRLQTKSCKSRASSSFGARRKSSKTVAYCAAGMAM